MNHHRCTGWLTVLLLLLFSAAAVGQANGNAERNARFLEAERALDAEDYPAALAGFRAIVAATPTPDSLAALAQHKIGVTHYNAYADSLAMVAYRRAVRMRDAVFTGPHRDRAHSRLNLAQVLPYLGSADSAAVLLKEAIDIYARAVPTDSLNWMRALTSLVVLAADARDYQVGISAARRAEQLVVNLQGVGDYDRVSTWYTVGSGYFTFGDLDAATRAARNARTAAEDAGDQYALMQIANLQGGIAEQQGQYRESLGHHLRALELSGRAEMEPLESGTTHFNVALRHKQLGEYPAAFLHIEHAFPYLAGHPGFHPRLLSLRGDVYRRSGQWERALTDLNEGIALLTPGGERKTELEPYQLEILADLLGDRAETLRKLNRSTEARADYRHLFEVQDQLRIRVTSDESRNYLSRNLRRYFDRAIDLEYELYRESGDTSHAWRAFEYSERARAFSLLSAVARDRSTMPLREARLRERIAQLERTAEPGTEAGNRLDGLHLELDRLLTRRAAGPASTQTAFDRNRLLGDLRQQQVTMVAYHLGDSTGYQFLIDPTGTLGWTVVPDSRTLPARIANWRDAIVRGAYRGKSLRAVSEQAALDSVFVHEGKRLRRQLFPAGLAGVKRLCLLPDGALHLFPFVALPAETVVSASSYETIPYLFDGIPVFSAYSARVWSARLATSGEDFKHDLLAFAPEFGSAAATSGRRAIEGLAPLRFNRAEVEDIVATVASSKGVYGSAADRGAFLRQQHEARVLHLSTHGVVDLARPELSYVAFTQLGDSLQPEEMLYYNDLAALPVRAELTVLSACETSLGAYVPGETSLSLASAFTAAGAGSTLTSLWRVDDEATRELMVAFYKELVAGTSKDGAVLAARTTLRNNPNYAHPYYWSAMKLTGNAGPIQLRQRHGWRGVLLVGLVLAVSILTFGLYCRGRRMRSKGITAG